MANGHILVEMDIGSSRTVLVQVPTDVGTYFGISASTSTADTVVTRRRKAHTRAVYGGLGDTTPTNANVAASTWQALVRGSRIGSGRLIVIPTKLKTPKDAFRTASFRVPHKANVASVSKFLFSKIDTTKRPDYFVFGQGGRATRLSM